MDIITTIIAIVALLIILGLLFRIVSFVLRIVSVVFLILLIFCLIGSYLQVQAYILPSSHESFLVATPKEQFVVIINKQLVSYDLAATISLQTGITIFGNESMDTQYVQLRQLATTPLFAQSDTVWFVDLRNDVNNQINDTNTNNKKNAECNSQTIIANTLSFTTNCLPTNQSLSWRTFFDTTARQQLLQKIPLKFDFWLWCKDLVKDRLGF